MRIESAKRFAPGVLAVTLLVVTAATGFLIRQSLAGATADRSINAGAATLKTSNSPRATRTAEPPQESAAPGRSSVATASTVAANIREHTASETSKRTETTKRATPTLPAISRSDEAESPRKLTKLASKDVQMRPQPPAYLPPEAVRDPQLFRAPDGTQVLRLPDGSTRVFRPGERAELHR
jgi:hypothetical protein